MEEEKKRSGKKILAAVLILLLAVIATGGVLFLKYFRPDGGTGPSILSGSVKAGSIRKTLSGTGILSEQEAEPVTAPPGVKLTAYLVKNGQDVSAGDSLAEVNRPSVMEAIAALRKEMKTVSDEISKIQTSSPTVYVTAAARGRIKAVYAAEGENVRGVLLRDGALAVISLDGRMAVQIRPEAAVKIGEETLVTLSGGETAPGRVETVQDGLATITINDSYGSIGETALVKTADGKIIGSGALSVHSPWKAFALDGVVQEVYLREGRFAEAEAMLFRVELPGNGKEFEALAAKHRDYEEKLERLFRIYESGVITAPFGGYVSGVDEEILQQLKSGGNSTQKDPSPDSDGVEILSITPKETVSVTITVDELDILTLHTGQSAVVTLDALPGRSFEGVISHVDTTPANQGGNTKYAAEIQMRREDKMLSGMNAYAYVIVENRDNTLLIPAEALTEEGGHAAVYTSYNGKSGELSGLKAVKTGLSDGLQVEILSGLQEGDRFWYSYYDQA